MPPSKNLQELTSLCTVEQRVHLITHLIYLPKLLLFFFLNDFVSYSFLLPGPIREKISFFLFSKCLEEQNCSQDWVWRMQ